MKLPWITAEQHAKALKQKEARIAELEAAATDTSLSETVSKLEALFGESAKEEGFDLVAAVESIQEAAQQNASALEASEQKLEAAQGQLNGVAKLLGHATAEGQDLVKLVSALQPEGRTTPVEQKEKKLHSKELDNYRCEIDEQIEKEQASFAIPPHHRN